MSIKIVLDSHRRGDHVASGQVIVKIGGRIVPTRWCAPDEFLHWWRIETMSVLLGVAPIATVEFDDCPCKLRLRRKKAKVMVEEVSVRSRHAVMVSVLDLLRVTAEVHASFYKQAMRKKYPRATIDEAKKWALVTGGMLTCASDADSVLRMI